ncbi:hypothetical protein LTR54_006425 [Friedmanniomyces endolithicus]|uniref:F-box domain-containing protein n=1 Tax=Friedmanniomyces endolithicus TaxID=329885 RepID=A0AAN6FCI5_9PEZI|nr:hypothetical protein LTR82_015036 [Friedmanniomyces endolithicus]KAK1007698.1 hypothetical protein LTR54_006425 [Friedmanniomyces endolithicus]
MNVQERCCHLEAREYSRLEVPPVKATLVDGEVVALATQVDAFGQAQYCSERSSTRCTQPRLVTMNEPISAQVARTDAARLLRRRHEYQLQRNAVQDSPLLALPAELLLEIVSYSGPIDRLCLRQASQQLRCQIATPSIPPHQLPATTHCLIKRLGRDDYIDLLRYEHGFRHLRATYLCCSACYRMHHRLAFTHAERAKNPRSRECKDAQAVLRVCSHETWTHAQLTRYIIKAKLDWYRVSDCVTIFKYHRGAQPSDEGDYCNGVLDVGPAHVGITTLHHLAHFLPSSPPAFFDARSLLFLPDLHICPHTVPTDAIFTTDAVAKLNAFLDGTPPFAPGRAQSTKMACCPTVADCNASIFFRKSPTLSGGMVYEMGVVRRLELGEEGLLPDLRDRKWRAVCEL